MMTKKIVRLTVDIIVDENTDVKQLVSDMDYDFVPMNDEIIHETEIIDYQVIDY